MNDIKELKISMMQKLQETSELRAEISMCDTIDIACLAALDKSVAVLIEAIKVISNEQAAVIQETKRMGIEKFCQKVKNDYRQTKSTKPTAMRIDGSIGKRLSELKNIYQISMSDVVELLLDKYESELCDI